MRSRSRSLASLVVSALAVAVAVSGGLPFGCGDGGGGARDAAVDLGAAGGDLAAVDLTAIPDLGGPQDLTPADAIVRVHYPKRPTVYQRITLRGDRAGLSWTAGTEMTRLDDTTWEYRIRALGATLEYKPLLDDATWSRGANYRVGPGQTVDVYPHFTTAKGRWERHWTKFHATKLDNDRGVWLYLPPSYDENPDPGNRFPVLYMHDGQNLFDPAWAFLGRTWKVPETLDAGIEALDPSLALPEVIVVGAENTPDRIYEYTPTKGTNPKYNGGGGDLYLDFLVSDLKPVVDREYRTLADADHTLLAGSSLGGLISAWAGTKKAKVFGRLGIFSPSTWWDDRMIIAAVKTSPERPLRVYVDSGDDDWENTRDLAQTYRDLGYRDGIELAYVYERGADHNEEAWARRLPGALRFLLRGL